LSAREQLLISAAMFLVLVLPVIFLLADRMPGR